MNLAELEGEALLLGIWKNIADLEEALCLQELQLLIKSSREVEHRRNKFLAALKGIDLDEGQKESAEDAFARVQRRAESRLRGVSEESLEMEALGMDIEVEE